MKHELTNKIKNIKSKTLYKIKALKNFADVKEGDLEEHVESEDNLSQDDNAKVYRNAFVYGHANISGNSYGTPYVYDKANISQTNILQVKFLYFIKKRILTAILTKDDKILYTIGCKKILLKKNFFTEYTMKMVNQKKSSQIRIFKTY